MTAPRAQPAESGPTRLVLRVFVPFSAGYFLSYLYRSVNAVIGGDVALSLGLSAADLGLVFSALFFAYGASQLPLGLLLDRFGPRRVEATLLVVAAIGAFIDAVTDSAAVFTLGRILLGLGIGPCLVAAYQAHVIWWPPRRVALLNPLVMAIGGVGALVGTYPARAFLHLTDWRGLLVSLSLITLVVAAVQFAVVPERPTGGRPGGGLGAQLRGLTRVFGDRLFWRQTPMILTTQGTFISFQTLWAGPWLRDVAGLDRDQATLHLLALAVALIAGFVTLGVTLDRLQRRGAEIAAVVGPSVAVFVGAQVILALELTQVALPAWMLFGFFGVAPIAGYARLTQHFPVELAGRAVTALNVLVFAAVVLFQSATGAVIGLWPALGVESYAREGYRAALALALAFEVPALLWFLWPDRRSPATNAGRG